MKNYPLYDVVDATTLPDLLELVAARYGDAPAFTWQRSGVDTTVSYRQLKQDVDCLAAALAEQGLHGAKIALVGENSYEWILTYLAVTCSGNVIVPLDKELPSHETRVLVLDSGAEVLIHSADYQDVADAVTTGPSGPPLAWNMATDLPAALDAGWQSEGTPASVIHGDDLAAILYTSGTTGRPKGVMLSHRNLAQDLRHTCQSVDAFGTCLLVLPLHHSFAFLVLLAELYYGCTIVICEGLKAVANDMKQRQPEHIILVPLIVETLYRKVWSTAQETGRAGLLTWMVRLSNALRRIGVDLRHRLFCQVLSAFGGRLRLIVTGGAPIDPTYVKGLRDLGILVLNGYGITECSPVVAVNRNEYYRDGSVGLPLPGVEVTILNPDAEGHGEIGVRGETVMLGYYHDEAATRAAFTDDGWFRTGDIGYLDKDGFLYISGRSKNVIILSNGKNVYPEELEQALTSTIPYLREALVFEEHQAIAAELYLGDNSPEAGQLDADMAAFNRTQPPYRVISRWTVRATEFPKTTTKKIIRQLDKGHRTP